ncbi:hypothetical protein VPH209E381_0092 [Vibrio phage 209E38-1]
MNIDNLELANYEPQEGNKQEKAESRKDKTCTKQQACKKCPCKRLDKERA